MSRASESDSSATSPRSSSPPLKASLKSSSFSRGMWIVWFLPSAQYWRLEYVPTYPPARVLCISQIVPWTAEGMAAMAARISARERCS